MENNCIGFIDPIGCFIIQMRSLHLDVCNEESLGYFKKKSYAEKLKEIHDA